MLNVAFFKSAFSLASILLTISGKKVSLYSTPASSTCVDLGVGRWVIISKMVLCNAIVIVIIVYDGIRPGLPNALAI